MGERWFSSIKHRNTTMKKYILLLSAAVSFSFANAQEDDLLKSLETDETAVPIPALFKCNRLVNGHTTETTAKHHLDYKIHHRFGKVNEGPYQLFGLDKGSMFLGFEYGVTKDFTVGVSRSTQLKMFTGSLKYKLMSQTTKGKRSKPLSIAFLTNIGCNGLSWADQGLAGRTNYFSSRLTFVNQLLIARRVHPKLVLQVAPMVLHQNLVTASDEPNDLFILPIGVNIRTGRSSRLNFEYQPVLNRYKGSNATTPFSIGYDIETGGHVFQLIISNSQGMVENLTVPFTTGKWQKGDVYFGFNILRFFSLGKR